jgi:hypothetical protein
MIHLVTSKNIIVSFSISVIYFQDKITITKIDLGSTLVELRKSMAIHSQLLANENNNFSEWIFKNTCGCRVLEDQLYSY